MQVDFNVGVVAVESECRGIGGIVWVKSVGKFPFIGHSIAVTVGLRLP